MEIKTLEAKRLAGIRLQGSYGSLDYEPACERLYRWQLSQGIPEDLPWYFLYLDNPETTAPEACRVDLCVLVDREVQFDEGIRELHFEGGRYAIERGELTDPTQYALYWKELKEVALAEHLECDERAAVEIYHRYDIETGEADVSFCLAVK